MVTVGGKQWEGRVVDERFHLLRYLGGSGHSAVFLTEFGEDAPRRAAIKLVPADMGKADAWMLRREFAARLSHPGLLSIYGFGTCRMDGGDLAYAVMESGDEDLSQVIPARPLTPTEAREMLLALIEILAYVHAEGFVHGRLTPANILAAGDRVKISSDCLLRTGESSGDLWAPDAGDPPESRSGVTPAADVWWLGMLLVGALTQRAPAWDRSGTKDPAVPETMAEPFRDIARRSLRYDPRLRCSLEDISRALRPEAAVPQTRPRAAAAGAAAKPAALPAARKRKYLLPVAGAVLAGVCAAGAIVTGLWWANLPHPAESRPVVPPAPPAAPVKPKVVRAGGKKPEARTQALAPRARGSSGGPTAGDLVEHFVPQVPAEYLATIHGAVSVSVRVKLDSAGAVVDAELDSRPASKYFDRVSLEAARRWRFKPVAGAGSTRVVHFEYHRDVCVASAD